MQYQPNYTGLRGWLVGDEARELCTKAAEYGVEYAQSIAPVGKPPDDEHPGLYRDSIHVEQAGLGGLKRDRVQVDVVASAPYSAVLEVQTKYRVLAQTVDAIEAAAKGK